MAIKVLRGPHDDDEGRRRMLREAKSMAQLSHPNVVPIYEVGELGRQLYIVMEHVDGQDLRAWLLGDQRTWHDVLEIYVQAGHGLATAHRAGIVHRDFKPENILLGRDGRARVLDFGLARIDQPPSDDMVHPGALADTSHVGSSGLVKTRAGTIVGTLM